MDNEIKTRMKQFSFKLSKKNIKFFIRIYAHNYVILIPFVDL